MNVELEHWIILITAVTSSIVTIIGAIFAGFIALKQIPRQNTRQDELHEIVKKSIREQNGKPGD